MNSDSIKFWSIHIEFVVIFVTLLGGFFMIDGKIERQGERIDRTIEMFNASMNQQSAKSDRLYEMFIDLLKRECDKKDTKTIEKLAKS